MKVLKSRVAESIGKESQRATLGTYFKAVILLAWFSLSYLGLFFSQSNLLSILLCVSLGFATAALGFNVFHDAIHGSFSYRRWENQLLAFMSCNLIGASHFIWRHKHNYLHHQFPNIQDWDDDLETRGGLRLSPTQPWLPKFRFQHIYAPFIYALTTLEWIFLRDYIRYFSSYLNGIQKLPKMTLSEHLEFWISKVIYIGLVVVLPLMFFPWLNVLLGLLIVHASASLVLAGIFQLAHGMEESQFPVPNASSGKIDMDWAQLQFATTVNFAPSNKILSWFCGGLNFQIEHHLLPGVCHAHYKKLSPILKATANEFGYPYYSLPTHWQAIRSHYRTLKKLATAPNLEPQQSNLL